jgi:hypothetical protein
MYSVPSWVGITRIKAPAKKSPQAVVSTNYASEVFGRFRPLGPLMGWAIKTSYFIYGGTLRSWNMLIISRGEVYRLRLVYVIVVCMYESGTIRLIGHQWAELITLHNCRLVRRESILDKHKQEERRTRLRCDTRLCTEKCSVLVEVSMLYAFEWRLFNTLSGIDIATGTRDLYSALTIPSYLDTKELKLQ